MYRDQLCLNHLSYREVARHVADIRQDWVNKGLLPGDIVVIRTAANKHETILNILASLFFKYIPVILPNVLTSSNDDIVCQGSVPPEYDKTALIVGTSGTSGSSKWVAHSDRSILSNLEGIRSYLPLKANENILVIRSLANLSVLTNEILLGIFNGAHIHTFEGHWSPLKVIRSLSALNIHYLVAVPTFMHFLIPYFRRHKEDLKSLRYLKCVGEVANMNTLKEIQDILPDTEIFNCYGLTEAGPRLTWWSSKQDELQQYAVGKPIEGVRIRVITEHNTVAGAFEKGIIQVASESMMIGYWRSPPAEQGYYTTMDWGWLDDKGFLFVEGRYDDLIVRGGVKIAPANIENTLLRHPHIDDALVEQRQTGNYNIVIRALVVVSKDCYATPSELLKWSREHLPAEYRIQEIKIVESIARLSNGKKLRGRGARRDGSEQV